MMTKKPCTCTTMSDMSKKKDMKKEMKKKHPKGH